MTQTPWVVVDPADNEDPILEDKTGTETNPDAWKGWDDGTKAPTKKKKNPYDDLKERLWAKLDEKDARIVALERESAINKFWLDVVDSPEVKEIMDKYPWMWYDEASKLANVEPKPNPWMYWLPWSTAVTITEDTTSVTWKDLESLKDSDPVKYKITLDKITEGTVAVV